MNMFGLFIHLTCPASMKCIRLHVVSSKQQHRLQYGHPWLSRTKMAALYYRPMHLLTCHVMVLLLHSISLKLCTTTSSIVALKEVLAPRKTHLNIRTNEVLNAISVTFTHVRFYFMHRLLPWYERHYIFKFSNVLYFCGLWLCVTLCLYQYWSKYVEGGVGYTRTYLKYAEQIPLYDAGLCINRGFQC